MIPLAYSISSQEKAAKAMYEYVAAAPDVRRSWLEAMPADRAKFLEMARLAGEVFVDEPRIPSSS